MKSLYEYLLEEEGGGDGGGVFQTPSNTIGMGNVSPDTDPLLAAPEGGTPKETTKIHKRRKKKRKDLRDFLMSDDIHKT